MMRLPILFPTALIVFGASLPAFGGGQDDRHAAATAFLELLEDDERASFLRDFDHSSRHGWSFFPARR